MKEDFHNNHEEFTKAVYNDETLLPDRYVFVVTNLCNLKCEFCFQWKNRIENSMTAKDWIILAKQLPPYARVTFTGGEPFMFRDFKEVFSYVCEKHNCNIISNGLLLNKERIDYILSKEKFRVLSISIDNIGNTVRGFNKKQWEYLKSMLEYFVKRRDELKSSCILDIKSTLLDETAYNIFKMYRYFVEELKCDTHSFQFLKGSPIQHSDIMYNFDEILKESKAKKYRNFKTIVKQLELVRKYNINNSKKSFLHTKVASLTSKTLIPDIYYINNVKHEKDIYLPCKYPWSSVHINPDGNLFPCLAVSMGNVKNERLSDIIQGKKFKEFKNIIRKNGSIEGCNRCGWLKPKNYAE